VKATGSVDAEITVDVSSQLSGRMAEVFVNFNDVVKAGQPLAQLDQESFLIAVKEAKAALQVATAMTHVQQAAVERAKLAIVNARNDENLAEALVASAQAKQDEAQREFERKAKLAKTESVAERDLSHARALRDTSAADLRAALEQVKMKTEAIEIAEADLRMTDANLENAEAVVEQKQAAVDQAELDLKRTVLRSPMDGVVIKRDVNPGQTVAVTLEAKTLFKIANNLASMEVHGKIDEADIGKLTAGQSARFTVDAYPERTFTGKVLQIRKASEVVQNVVTYTAVISAPNSELLLLPGMTAELRILVSDTGDTLKIPNQALRFSPEAAHATSELKAQEQRASPGTLAAVWVVGKDGRPAPITVHVGESDDNSTQLLDGPLTKGQPLIVGVGNSQVGTGFLGLRLGF
jgi:HlyD family secretion protein